MWEQIATSSKKKIEKNVMLAYTSTIDQIVDFLTEIVRKTVE